MPEPNISIPLPLLELCTYSGPQQQQSKWPLTASTSPPSVLPGLLLIVKNKENKEKLEEIGARLEHAPRKSLRCLAQETGILKSAATATKLLKLTQYKVTVLHALQPCVPVNRNEG
jgi:hypothetical protein